MYSLLEDFSPIATQYHNQAHYITSNFSTSYFQSQDSQGQDSPLGQFEDSLNHLSQHSPLLQTSSSAMDHDINKMTDNAQDQTLSQQQQLKRSSMTLNLNEPNTKRTRPRWVLDDSDKLETPVLNQFMDTMTSSKTPTATPFLSSLPFSSLISPPQSQSSGSQLKESLSYPVSESDAQQGYLPINTSSITTSTGGTITVARLDPQATLSIACNLIQSSSGGTSMPNTVDIPTVVPNTYQPTKSSSEITNDMKVACNQLDAEIARLRDNDRRTSAAEMMVPSAAIHNPPTNSAVIVSGYISAPHGNHPIRPGSAASVGTSHTYESSSSSAASPPLSSGKARSHKSVSMGVINMDDQEKIKIERKRARNRAAATKCRKKKLERISKLEDKTKILRDENDELQGMVSRLRDEVCKLKSTILEHHKNGCNIPLV